MLKKNIPAEVGDKPEGDRTITVVAMPSDTNPSGEIFGGWILSQMDIAGGVQANRVANGKTATVGVENVKFMKPVKVGDLVSCYTQVKKIGNTSVSINISAWTTNHYHPGDAVKVTEGLFTYVAIDKNGLPISIRVDN
jgi:acyl-CoA thioesterase YciA